MNKYIEELKKENNEFKRGLYEDMKLSRDFYRQKYNELLVVSEKKGYDWITKGYDSITRVSHLKIIQATEGYYKDKLKVHKENAEFNQKLYNKYKDKFEMLKKKVRRLTDEV